MTGAPTGLQAAVVRNAIAAMQADDIIANLNADQKAALQAALAPAIVPSGAADDGNSENTVMTQEEIDKAVAEASSNATASANQRFAAVLASEHFAGRESLAVALLGNEGLSADVIISALAATPKSAQVATNMTAEQQAAAAAEAGRLEMQAALAANGNSNIDANDKPGGKDPKSEERAKADAVWTKAYGLTPA